MVNRSAGLLTIGLVLIGAGSMLDNVGLRMSIANASGGGVASGLGGTTVLGGFVCVIIAVYRLTTNLDNLAARYLPGPEQIAAENQARIAQVQAAQAAQYAQHVNPGAQSGDNPYGASAQ